MLWHPLGTAWTELARTARLCSMARTDGSPSPPDRSHISP
jgi:hypothetical protein